MMVDTALIVILALLAAILGGRWWLARRALSRAQADLRRLNDDLRAASAGSDQPVVLRHLGEVAFNALLVADEKRMVRALNHAARDLFGRQDYALPEGGETVIAVTRHHQLDDLIGEALASDQPIEEQLDLNGRPYRVRLERFEAGGGQCVAVALDDIGELRRLGRARRDMVANVSHELRTPISSIRLLVDTLIRAKDRNTSDSRDMLDKIATQTDHIGQLAQELLDLSMIESGRAEMILRPVAVEPVIDEAVAHVWELATRTRLHVEKHVQGDVIALADAEHVRRVLANLLHNAVKFTSPGGHIAIDVSADAEWVKICVADSGPGIPPEERERVFERFYRGDRSRQSEGTGLGLAIAKHIVEAHSGRIWVSERPPTDRGPVLTGACVCFTLPLAG